MPKMSQIREELRAQEGHKHTNKRTYLNSFIYTVVAVCNCVGHDGTSYAVLKHVEVEFVTLSLSFHCFTEPSNLSTQTRGFCMLAHSAGGPGE